MVTAALVFLGIRVGYPVWVVLAIGSLAVLAWAIPAIPRSGRPREYRRADRTRLREEKRAAKVACLGVEEMFATSAEAVSWLTSQIFWMAGFILAVINVPAYGHRAFGTIFVLYAVAVAASLTCGTLISRRASSTGPGRSRFRLVLRLAWAARGDWWSPCTARLRSGSTRT